MVVPFVKPLGCFKMEGLEFLQGSLILLICPGISHLVDVGIYVSPSFYARHCIFGILIQILQASQKQASKSSDITLELMTLNPLGVVSNKDMRLWKILLQLIYKPHLIIICFRCHNCIGQNNLIVVSFTGDSKQDNLIKGVTFQKCPLYKHTFQIIPCLLCS